ncbi:protein kinase domain-containing protein [Streptomyces apocyni]|uniref:protein kinase domain-containing protein n=1 Tax=Streptomyces apocyni TaxID=2654677 RepID=UPI001E4BFCDB|nr:protein kinase [Streptomyces apocyni]
MDQQRAQGPSDPEATGGGMSDAPELWGNGGLVGDGRYRLTHRLGRGGMAEVFAAEDVRLGRTVAVKLLRTDLAEDPISKARFTREAQSVAGLNHHAVVAVYDSGEDVIGANTIPYIVMELVEGHTIRDLLINAEAPGPEQALIIVSGVLEALAYSHQHGIVHRDIKPANVIITHGGAVKVMDFGIARALHGASNTMTQTGMVMGTPQYLSPEQALGKAVDHRSDLYATGCLLYELLALRPPFTGETPLSVVYQHVQDIPVPPSEMSDAAPPELDGLAMRALAKDPDDRFQSAEEMRGLVQYGLQMLQEQGGHTGTWNTGPVDMHESGSTPTTGLGGAALGHPDGGTAQQPMLRTPGDDGGFDGGYQNGGGRRGGRGKMWIVAALAVVAIGSGIALALNNTDEGGGGKNVDNSPSTSVSPSEDAKDEKDKESKEPKDDDPTTRSPANPGGVTGGGGGGWTPPKTTDPTEDPTDDPTEDPTEDPTDDPTDDPTGGTDTGGTTEGGDTTGGTTEGGDTTGGDDAAGGTTTGDTTGGGDDAAGGTTTGETTGGDGGGGV